MNQRMLCALAAVTVFAPGCLTGQQARERGASTITEEDFAQRVGVIAHDSMQGRATPSRGLELTAAWIAAELRDMGLRGGAPDGSFVQRYPLRAVAVDAAGSSLRTGSGTGGQAASLSYGPDILPLVPSRASGEATGQLVLVSGSTDPERALRGAAVRGKHAVLVAPGSEAGVDRTRFSLAIAIRRAGAASVLVTNASDDDRWRTTVAAALEPEVETAWGGASVPAEPFRPLLQVRTSSLESLLAGTGVDLAALQRRATGEVRVDAVDGWTLTLTQRLDTRSISAPNVVGIVDGSDPVLRDEYVVFSAHMDHLGIGGPDESGDSIFNGADDDASGTVAVMEVAQAVASLPIAPRRSMIFLLVSGEERGLWGSEYYADNPSVPVDRIAAGLNADMVGRNWPDTIVAIGKEHSDLGATLERVNGAHPEIGMTAIDDLWPEERFYFRSDHYNFARKGVPILFFFNGTHDDYHGLDDEPGRIDAEKAARITRLLFHLGVDVANADARPRWHPESYERIVTDRGGAGSR
jgi:hypothetical protein